MKKKLLNFKGGTIKVQWNEAAEAEAVELMIYDTIGSDPWSDGGITAEDIRNSLKEIPRGRNTLHLRVNSKGGDVHEGMAIMQAFDEFPGKIIAFIDGIAASTASWMILSADEIRAPRASQVFIHDAMAFGLGNAAELMKTADQLDKTSDQIAAMYSAKTGKSKKYMRDLMRDETLLTGEEAEELGLVDTIIEGKAIRNFKPAEMVEMKNRLQAFYNSVAGKGAGQTTNQNHKEQSMKKRLIALLNKHGVTEMNGVKLSNSMTDVELEKVNEEQLEAAFEKIVNDAKSALAAGSSDDVKQLRAELNRVTEFANAAKKLRITDEIEAFIGDDKVPANQKDSHIKRAIAMTDADCDTYLNELRERKPNRPGADPLPLSIECKSESFLDVQNYVLDNGPRFNDKFFGKGATLNLKNDPRALRELSSRSIVVANAIAKNKDKIISAWNANAIDSALQRQVILQDMLEAYATVLINLDVFSTVYQNVPLEGTDKVEVPYFPLQATASTSFVAGTGYTTSSDWTQNSREVLVGGDGAAASSGANAAANTAKDRKYQMINFDSYDLRRQPYLNLSKLFQQAANKLGIDIFTDIVSRVITTASYGASIKARAAAAFSADDVADMDETATGLMWPQMGRSMVLDHTYFTPLLKDPSFKQYLSYGNADAIQSGRIKSAYSFDNIVKVPTLTAFVKAGEFMVGWINHKSAVLCATANVVPSEAVRNLLIRFDVVTDPKTGISFAYRVFADAVKDRTFEVVESSYGANKGVDNALRRMTSQ